MKDRTGNETIVGYSEAEILWLRAAVTLGRIHRSQAFRDIASMTGRNFHAVQDKAYKLRAEDRELRQRAIDLTKGYGTRSILMPVRRVSGLAQSQMPDTFRWPSKDRLMGARASSRRIREIEPVADESV